MDDVIRIIYENNDKRICVVGTTCTGKSSLIKQSGIGIDMDELLYPMLTEEETAYIDQVPWTPKIGSYVDELAKGRIKIECGSPVFGTVVLPSDLIIYLDIDDETLKQRCQTRKVNFEDAKNMNELIKEDLSKTKTPIISIKVTTPILAKDVEHIRISGFGHPIYSIDDLYTYFEIPLLDSGIDLFNKNIKTLSNNTGDGNAQITSDIIIDFETLSNENKEIVTNLINEGKATLHEEDKSLGLSVATSSNDTVEDIKARMLDLTAQLELQDILYGRYNLDNIGKILGYLRQQYGEENFREYCTGDELSADKLIKYLRDTLSMPNAVFDYDENIIWEHENYYQKHKEYLRKQEENNSRAV